MKNLLEIYNAKRSLFSGDLHFADYKNHSSDYMSVCIIIPACDEVSTLFDTLDSIQASKKTAMQKKIDVSKLHTVIVVNNTKDSPLHIKEQNQHLLKMLKDYGYAVYKKNEISHTIFKYEQDIAFDCAGDDCEMPNGQGVGWARKFGMDFAILCKAQVLACMDSDTLVSENYVEELFRFEQICKNAKTEKHAVPCGAVMNFYHQKAENPHMQQAIDAYEFFIKHHSDCLKKTGTPYWLWALGPTVVSSLEGYIASGGMNKRLAGEDFYFLQSLIKLHVQQNSCSPNQDIEKCVQDFFILDCKVYPQARYSNRVLYGTGQKLLDVVSGKQTIDAYPDNVYDNILEFLQLFLHTEGNPPVFFDAIQKKIPIVWDFLQQEKFVILWEKMYRQNNCLKRRFIALHSWFDGLKILRFIHFFIR